MRSDRTPMHTTSAYTSRTRSLRASLQLLFFFAFYGSIAGAQIDLSGTWIGDDFGIYYVRQIGNDVWWAGFSSESPYGRADLHRGLIFTSVFRGTLTGNQLVGSFVDVPKGQMLTSGPLTLTVINGNSLASQSVPNAYRANSWERYTVVTPSLDVFTLFGEVKKNQDANYDHTLLDNLKPAKTKPVSILGRITNTPAQGQPNGIDPYVVKVAYPPTSGRTYNDFSCLGFELAAANLQSCALGVENCPTFIPPPDGDLTFDIHVDRGALDQQIGFWTSGWETSHKVTPTNFGYKLNVDNRLHAEIVMYGGTTECSDSEATQFLAPGWQQQGSLGALFNGVPIAGNVNFAGQPDSADGVSILATSVLGTPIGWNSFVRINGILALDCGHGEWWHDWSPYDPRPCNEDDPTYQNQEIHPVYSVDLIQDFSQPRPFANLTGVWAADDAGTYYLRQEGNTVWWLGVSTDEGQSFANVFQGTLQNNQISGNWADVPLGQTDNAGMMTINVNNGIQSFMMNRTYVTGGFGGGSWEKLYDAGGRTIIIVLDQAEVAPRFWPENGEELEVQVGPTRVRVKPQKAHIVKLPNGSEVMQASIPARIRVDAPELGDLQMSAQFAGYCTNWRLSQGDFKGGTHAQAMTPPLIVRTATSENEDRKQEGSPSAKKKESAILNESSTSLNRNPATDALPAMTIRYHIEPADASGHDRLPK